MKKRQRTYSGLKQHGRSALRQHMLSCAHIARERYAPFLDLKALLLDSACVRFPTELVFDASPLEPGFFAEVLEGEGEGRSYRLAVHPIYRDMPEALPWLVAYHLPRISYGRMPTIDDVEAFGAVMLGVSQDDYYKKVCELADLLPA